MRSIVVFDIKEFAVFDGPGIRQTVFLKGCPLRCNWCHNPEGLAVAPQIIINEKSCKHCRKCDNFCKKDICDGCGHCVKICTDGFRRVAGEIMTSGQLIDVIKENTEYYARYGGGVTFSGGEPLMQGEALLEVIVGLKGVNIAVETSGYADPDLFKRVVNAVDYVLMDIKHTDSGIHKKHTGVGNERILQNLELLKKSGTPFIIRIPLIPGVNDSDENLRNTALLIKDADNLVKIELLPYHKAAGAKYNSLGMKYSPMFDINQTIKINKKIFDDYRLECSVL